MNPRHRRHHPSGLRVLVGLTSVTLILAVVGMSVRAVVRPHIDAPERVDGIVVVAGNPDDRYVYGRSLAEDGVADEVLLSRPGQIAGKYGAELDHLCASSPVTARDGRQVTVECFTPDIDTTEGETRAATRIARERGWNSLLVVTYWGHVSRVRLYFEQCFDGAVFVTDTPRPTQISKKYAITHETGGYVKALISPAC